MESQVSYGHVGPMISFGRDYFPMKMCESGGHTDYNEYTPHTDKYDVYQEYSEYSDYSNYSNGGDPCNGSWS